MVTPVPAPPAGTGLPAVKSGHSEAAAAIAVAVAARAKASVITAPADDIAEGREDVGRVQSYDCGPGTLRKDFS